MHVTRVRCVAAGHLLSASDDGTVCLWNVEATPTESVYLDALGVFAAHSSIVEDVQWHQLHDCIFGSVGDDRMLMMLVRQCGGRAGPVCVYV